MFRKQEEKETVNSVKIMIMMMMAMTMMKACNTMAERRVGAERERERGIRKKNMKLLPF